MTALGSGKLWRQHSPLLPLVDQVDDFARQSGLVRRFSHRFSALGFLTGLLQAATWGHATLCSLATLLADTGLKPMARQSMFKRLSERSTCFLELVLCSLVTRRIQTSLCSSARDSLPFRRVILEDSTTLPMSPGNHAEYPAGGGSGRSAGAKLRLMIDLLGSAVLEISRHTGATPDQALCDDALTVCAEGDLLVRDMGFFRMGSLKRLSDKGVRWLTRLPASTSARTSDGTTLLELLTRPGAQEIDCEIVIGGSSSGAEPLRARLVARRLPQEIAERHRRERRKKSKGQGKTASKESMERAGWTIMVTDVAALEVAAADLFSIYSQRWTVEIVFRAIKGAARAEMALGRRRRKDHQDALILATAIPQCWESPNTRIAE